MARRRRGKCRQLGSRRSAAPRTEPPEHSRHFSRPFQQIVVPALVAFIISKSAANGTGLSAGSTDALLVFHLVDCHFYWVRCLYDVPGVGHFSRHTIRQNEKPVGPKR